MFEIYTKCVVTNDQSIIIILRKLNHSVMKFTNRNGLFLKFAFVERLIRTNI